MQLTSSAFGNNQSIPSVYTCDGKNISPPLAVADVPASAQSLVLLVDDPDIPQVVKDTNHITEWVHWVVFNIPSGTREIFEGTEPAGMHGITTSKVLKYGGPCPPDREHRYFFRLYALDTLLTLPAGVTKAQVVAAMQNHILASAELVGLYNRH